MIESTWDGSFGQGRCFTSASATQSVSGVSKRCATPERRVCVSPQRLSLPLLDKGRTPVFPGVPLVLAYRWRTVETCPAGLVYSEGWLLAWGRDAVLVGKHYGLHSITQIELHEDRRHMGLHG